MNASGWPASSIPANAGATVYSNPPYELVPSPVKYPFYHIPKKDVLDFISDKHLSLLAPIVIYWGVSLLFHFIDISDFAYFEKYRIHEPEETKRKNKVTAKTVVIMVMLQQVAQTMLGMYWLDEEDPNEVFRDHRGEMQIYAAHISRLAFAALGPKLGSQALRYGGAEFTSFVYWWGLPLLQFAWASFILDTWQYFLHRYFHTNKFLYRHIHSLHHRLYCPYAFGALYNHPLEGFLLDTLGTAIAHWASLMSTRQAIILFGFSTLKTVDDHCGFSLPWDPLQIMFGNNVAYHDIHHQQFGIKKNFSQPYFTHWDVILNTRMTSEQVPLRHREKYHAGPCKLSPSETTPKKVEEKKEI